MLDNDLNMLLMAMDSVTQSVNNATNIVATSNINRDNREWQSKEAEKARFWQSKEAELAFERQQEMFDTRYSPSAQIVDKVRGYKEAGLNPILAAEGSVSAQPSSAPMASGAAMPSGAGTSNFSPMTLFSLLDRVMAIQRQKAEIANINADTAQTEKQTSWIDVYNSTSIQSMRAGIDEVRSNIEVNEQSVQESLQRIKESMKKMDVYDSQIEVNGALVDLHGSQQVLNESRAIVEQLNAKQIAALLPYIQKRQEAEIAFTQAKTEEARRSAESLKYDANLRMVKFLTEAKLLTSSYYDAVISQANWDVRYKKREYHWKPVNDICHNVSMIAIGAGSVMSGVGGAASGLGQAAVVSRSLAPRNPIGY